MWEAGGFFKPHNDPNKPDFDPNVKPFVISIPPPNVTGELHHRSRHVRQRGRLDDPLSPHEGLIPLYGFPAPIMRALPRNLMVERDLLKPKK
jgi:hypothetical protein